MDESTFDSETKNRDIFKVDFSCDFLLQTFREAVSSLKKSNIESSKLFNEAIYLLDDVLRLHQYERLMIRHELLLLKELFRSYYAAFPGKPETCNTSFLSGTYSYWEYKNSSGNEKKLPTISVIISLKDSYEFANRAIIKLIYDISMIKSFKKEIHICVDRTEDDTIRRVLYIADTFSKTRDISFHIYILDEIAAPGISEYGPGIFGKPIALQVVTTRIKESKEKVKGPGHYIYIADDDIVFVDIENNSTIKKLLDLLQKPGSESIKMVSGTYCTFEKQLGFGLLTSVRKLKEYYPDGLKLPNLYGGCMACRLDDFPKYVPKEAYGMDSYLTIYFLRHLLTHTDVKNQNFEDFCFADTSVIVGHPEPQQVITAIKRLQRDEKFREQGIKDLFDQVNDIPKEINTEKINNNFLILRNKKFQEITDKINQEGSIRHRICQAWYKKIREKAKAKPKDRAISNMEQLREINWKSHKSDHEICTDIVRSDTKFTNLLDSLVRYCPFGSLWAARLRNSNTSKEERLQMAAFLLYRYAHYLPKAVILRDPYLFHFLRISFMYIGIAYKLELFSPTHRYRSLLPNNHVQYNVQCKQDSGDRTYFSGEFLPFNLNDPFSLGELAEKVEYASIAITEIINRALDSIGEEHMKGINSRKSIDADSSLATFTRECNGSVAGGATSNREFFIRYFPVMGASRFAPISPRRQIYLQVLGEQVFETILGPSHVLKSLYPSLKRAFLSYLGPEKRHPYEIALESVLIQRSIRTSKETQLSFICFNKFDKVLDAYAELLAKLHGRTLGVFNRMKPERWEGLKERPRCLLEMLWEHQDQLRLFSKDVYNQWISSRGNFASRVRKLLDSETEDGNLFSNVRKIVRGSGYVLSNLWENLSMDSTKFYDRAAAIGHLYLSFDNILVSTGDIDGEKVEKNINESDMSFRDSFSIASRRKRYRFKYNNADLKDSANLRLYRFDWVFFLDPAYEFGKSLSYIYRHFLDQLRATRDFPDLLPNQMPNGDPFHWFVSIRQKFQKKYQTVLRNVICRQDRYESDSWPMVTRDEIECNNEQDVSMMVSELVDRGLRYAGFRLLDDYAYSSEFEHPYDVRQALGKLIIDLLQFGLPMTIHYPDGDI